MVINSTKRKFLKKIGLYSSFLALNNFFIFKNLKSKNKVKPKVVIIGYGIGGATCLEYLMNYTDLMDIIIIEKNKKAQTCPMSNLVLSEIMSYKSIVHEFNHKRLKDIKFINRSVEGINPHKKSLSINGGVELFYDFLILSPGVGFKNDIEGYLIGMMSCAKTIDLISVNNGASNNGDKKYSAFKLFINFGTAF